MNKIRCIVAGLILLVACGSVAWALEDRYPFQDLQQQSMFTELLTELRCLVCQNQSLADSNAPLADDLRAEIYRMIQAGEDRDSIVAFLVDRYGEFVLYKPPLTTATSVLWIGPFSVLIIALFFWLRYIRRQNYTTTEDSH